MVMGATPVVLVRLRALLSVCKSFLFISGYFYDDGFFLGPFGLPDGVPSAFGRCGNEGEDPVGVFDNQRVSLKRCATSVARVVREEFHQWNPVFGSQMPLLKGAISCSFTKSILLRN